MKTEERYFRIYYSDARAAAEHEKTDVVQREIDLGGYLVIVTSKRMTAKDALDKDMKLIMSCVYDSMMPGMARQGTMEVMGMRMLVCFTSKQRAKQANYNTTWDIAKARDLMNNMFNKDKIAGIVFNPNDENMVIVLKDLILPIMPGEKPKPEFYRE